MRRITAIAVSALALVAGLGATAGTAGASTDSTWKHGGPAKTGSSYSALATPIGKKHYFNATTKGAGLAGNWYFYHGANGKSTYVWLTMMIKDTKADGLASAVCFKTPLTTSSPYCYWSTKGHG